MLGLLPTHMKRFNLILAVFCPHSSFRFILLDPDVLQALKHGVTPPSVLLVSPLCLAVDLLCKWTLLTSWLSIYSLELIVLICQRYVIKIEVN